MKTNRRSQLNKEQKDIFDGIMISDGHLKSQESQDSNSTFTLVCKHKGFAESIKKSLPLDWGEIRHYYRYDKRTKKSYHSYSLASKRDIFLTNERKRWYPEDKKMVPNDFKLTRLSLLWWYLGDGCLLRKITKPTYRRIQFAVNCFTEEEKLLLINKLKEFLRDNNVYREADGIVVSRSGITKFANILGQKSPVKEYQYKFDFGQYLDKNYFKNNYNKRWSVTQFGSRMRDCNSKKVVCVESGQIYSSITEASKKIKRCLSAVSCAVIKGTLCAGNHWKYKES